jgi:uncharacterized Zn finger protein
MSWWSYDDAAEQKARLQREIAKRIKRGERFDQVIAPKGRKLATQFWGQAWQQHFEGMADYESRLPRGRTYLRAGHVYNLEIVKGEVTAEVTGSEIYDVRIVFQNLNPTKWKQLKTSCAGRGMSLLDLLAGKVGDDVLRLITDAKEGLFPRARDIRFDCSCPDDAGLCKHTAAVLYAIALRFDAEPELFFRLRGVDHRELIDEATATMKAAPATSTAPTIDEGDLSALFGIELGAGDSLSIEAEQALTKKTAAKKATAKKKLAAPALKKPVPGSKRAKAK